MAVGLVACRTRTTKTDGPRGDIVRVFPEVQTVLACEGLATIV